MFSRACRLLTPKVKFHSIQLSIRNPIVFSQLAKNIIVNLVGSIRGIGTMVIGWKEYNRYFGSALQEELKRKILQSTYTADCKKSSLYIRRDGLPDILNIFGAKEKQKTVVVCGPRGSGKSAAVRDSLEGKNGVVVATYTHDEGHVKQELACAITETLGLHTNKQVSHLEVVVNALKEIRSETEYAGLGHPPVLVVEVNKRFMSPKALEELALTLKDWGHDKALVRPIVVLSTSRAACHGVGDWHG